MRWIRAVMGLVLGASALIFVAEPAAACSCGAGPAPTIDFTGVAVEDLGYTVATEPEGLGETRAWLMDVNQARAGVDTDRVRICNG